MKIRAKRIAALALAAMLCINTAAQAAPADAGTVQAVTETAAETETEAVTEKETGKGTGTEKATEKAPETEKESRTEKVTEGETETGSEKVTKAETETGPEKVTESETGKVAESGTEAEKETEPSTEKKASGTKKDSETETDKKTKDSEKNPSRKDGKDQEETRAPYLDGSGAEEAVTDVVAEAYLKEHVDSKYVPEVEKVDLVSAMVAKQTLVDRGVVGKNPTIDGVMNSDRKGDALITQFDSAIALYDLSEDSKYCVGLVNTMLNDADARVTDYAFAEYNNGGVVLDGCYYDRQTGIAYVPKSLLENGDGKVLVGYVQVQLLQVIGYEEGENVDSAVVSGTVVDGEADASVESAGIFSMQTTVQAKAGLDEESVEVAVNGIPLEGDAYEYDKESGEVVISRSSATIGTVSVTADEETIFTRIRKFFSPLKSKAAADTPATMDGINANGKINVDDSLDVTKAISGTADFLYAKDSEPDRPSEGYLLDSASPSEAQLKAMADFIANKSDSLKANTELYKASTQTNFWVHLDTLELGEKYEDLIQFKDLDDETAVALTCAHVGNYLGVSTGKGQDRNGSWWVKGGTVKVRVLYVDRDADQPFVLLGIVTETTFTQTGIGIVKLYTYEKEQYGRLKIRKTPDNDAKVDLYGMAANGGVYDMTAVFGVYSSRDAAEKQLKDKASRPGVIRTGPWGRCKQPLTLDVGTYWLRELRSEGSGILVSDEIRKFEIKKDKMTYIGYEVDTALYEPHVIPISVKKVAGGAAVVNGNANYSLAGAVYGLYEDAACTRAMVKRDGTAITMTTDADGNTERVMLSDVSNYGYGTYYVKETASPAGYALDPTVYPVTIDKDNLNAAITSTDVPKVAQADIKLKKVAAGGTTQKSTAGALFKVEYFMNYDCSGTAARTWYFKSKNVEGDEKLSSESTIAFTQEYFDHGDALYEMNGRNVLPLGSIRVTEEQAPKGYVATDDVFTGTIRDTGTSGTSAVFTWSDGNTAEYELEVPNESKFGGIVLQKVDGIVYAANGSAITAESKKPQGDASLAGAVFAVYNANDYNVVTRKDKEKAIAPGEEVCRITTDDKGVGRTGQVIVLEEGKPKQKEILQADSSYRIVEINPSTGMKVNDGFDMTVTIPDEEEYVYGAKPEELLELTCPEPVIRGDVQIRKFDKELDKSEALAGKDHGASGEDVPDLSGIEFEIRNVSERPVFLYGDPGQEVSNVAGSNLCMTITTHWNEAEQAYTAETAGQALPYGTYTVQEVSTNETYLLTDGEAKTFCIREDGSLVKVDEDGEDLVFKNYVVREDVKFNKIAENSSRRMQTAWVITNNVTGEAHVAVTDRNGFFDSSAAKNKHTYHTNGNDGLLAYMGTEDVIKTAEMDDKAGIWFGMGENGTMAKADDTLRALPYGSYTLTELRCEDNEGFDLQEFTFWVSDNDTVVELGTVTDHNEPEISTIAVDQATKEHFGKAAKDTVIIDTVHCTGLDKGTEYTLRASIHNYGDEDSAFKVDGRRVKAEKTFTATSAAMDVPVEIAFDATAYAGMTGVVYEELYRGDIKEAEHTDIEDEAQRISFPAIGTQARDEKSGAGIFSGAGEDGKAVIIDTVAYQNLVPGKEHTLKGTIYDKDTGKAASGMVEQTFTPEEPDGMVELRFEFEPDQESRSFVAFEKLYYGEAVIAEHEDLEDEDQTVRKPSISTTAKDSETGTGEAFADEEVTIIDTVAYTNLKAGLAYTLKGILMDKATGEPLLADGKEVTAEAELVPESMEGTIDMEFTFNASGMEGRSLVVFEELYYGELLAASHSDIKDEGQTITFPKIRTKAEDAKTKLDESLAEEKTTVADTVLYSGLTPGKTYTVSGVLMDKKTGEPLLADGKTVTATKEFVPEKPDGSVQLSFTFNASALAGSTVVAFEDLHQDGKLVAVHADITDKDQTVYLPQIGTQAVDKETGTHEGNGGKKTVLVDTVAYRNLAPGTEYTVKGVLMDKQTGAEVKVNGKAVTSEAVFTTPENGLDDNGRVSGTVELSFTFDATALKNSDTVVFERLYHAGKEVAVHTDLQDEGQTVRYPQLKTTATDKVTETHEQLASKRAAIVDTVAYSGLTPGKEYVLKGTLYDKSTKKPLKSGGKTVTAEKKFIPEQASGTAELTFHFDSSPLEGKTVVAFEELYRDGKLVGIHADIKDEGQSVRILKIRTKAKDKKTGGSTMSSGKDSVLTDTVTYKNLEKGKKYAIEGVVMDRETGEPVKIGGKEVTARKTFKAKAAKGSEAVEFKLDTGAVEGKTLVVFEKLYDNKGNLVAVHEDINDKGQTVSVPQEKKTPGGKTGTSGGTSASKSPKTGDDTPVVPLLAAAAAAAGVLACELARRRKKKARRAGQEG